MAIPDPLEGGPAGGPPAATYDAVYEYVLQFSRENGFGIVKAAGSNRVNGEPTRYEVYCDRGSRTKPLEVKSRQTFSQKIDCPGIAIAARFLLITMGQQLTH